jgi:hypothetical protein
VSLFHKKKPPEPPAKTLEQCMKEIIDLGTPAQAFSRVYSASQVSWLKGYSWTKLDYHSLLCSEALYPHVARIYAAQKSLDGENTVENKLKKENEKLKKQVADLTAEVERLSQPTGRKIVLEKGTTA